MFSKQTIKDIKQFHKDSIRQTQLRIALMTNVPPEDFERRVNPHVKLFIID